MYLPNDAWFVPNVTIATKRFPVIADNVVAHPVTLINDYMRGIGDETTELMMMVDNYGIYGTIGDALSVFESTHNTQTFYNMDGTPVDQETRDNTTKAIQTLREKYGYIRGHRQRVESEDGWKDYFVEISPGLTKIAFGGNLALATITVEYAMNTITSLWGPQGIKGFIRSALAAPQKLLAGEEYKETARDILDLIGTMTQAHVPEYERPLISARSRKKGSAQVINAWGNQMMRPSQWVMESMAVARAQILRKSVFDLLKNERLRDLVKILNDPKNKLIRKIERDGTVNFRLDADGNLEEGVYKQSAIELPDPMALEGYMREAGISVRKYGRVIHYLLRAGFLDSEGFGDMATVLNEVNTQDGKGTYSPMRMYNQLTKTSSIADRDTYHKYLDVIGGLKIMEKAYIQEIMVSPNPFDINTNDTRSERLFELYRRYGMLFVSQLVMRNANHMGLTAIGFRVITLCTLDMLYMTLLRLANGDDLEDLLEEIGENPTQFFITYGARLPIMGRYFNIWAEAIVQLTTDSPWKRNPGAFISIAGALAMMNNLKSFITNLSTGELTEQDWISAARILPFIGDSIPRMAVYALMDDPNTKRGRATSSQLGGGAFSTQGFRQDFEMEEMMRHTLQELDIRSPGWRADVLANREYQGVGGSMSPADASDALREPEIPVQPEVAQKVPQPTLETEVSQTASQDVVEQIEKQAKSLGIPESTQIP